MTTQPQQAERPINWVALIETVLLTGAAAMLLTKALRGILDYYIHPRYAPLVIVCGIVLLLVAGVRMRAIFGYPSESLRGRRNRYILLAIPILLGTIVPAKPLGANVLSSTAIGASVAPSVDLLDDDNTERWNLLQWSVALSIRGEELNGQPVDLVGFAFHDSERPFGGFVTARYVITCCTADGAGTGLPVVWEGGAAIPPDTWVQIRGTLRTTEINGRPEPAIVATSVEVVPQPDNPYLYP
jgi:uncharacterized repeat protein (TIGR03943 family)